MIFRMAAVSVLLLLAAACAEDEPHLLMRARLAASCAVVGETERPTSFGDGSIGVNTTFRAAYAAQAVVDENLLALYFSNPETGETEIPGEDRLAGRVWVVDEHDTSGYYREEGVVVCYSVFEAAEGR